MTTANKKTTLNSVKALREALYAFSEAADNDSDEVKTPREREIHNHVNNLYMKLGKYSTAVEKGEQPREETQEERVSSMLMGLATSLGAGDSPLSDKSLTEFEKVLELGALAKTAKIGAKKAAMKHSLSDEL